MRLSWVRLYWPEWSKPYHEKNNSDPDQNSQSGLASLKDVYYPVNWGFLGKFFDDFQSCRILFRHFCDRYLTDFKSFAVLSYSLLAIKLEVTICFDKMTWKVFAFKYWLFYSLQLLWHIYSMRLNMFLSKLERGKK